MSLLLVILMGFLCHSNAHTFYVGGDDGWKLHPSVSYSRWAKRYRFLINDELVFKHKTGHDSVLVVNHNDYSKCNKENPIKALKGGDSLAFKLEKSGPFFFHHNIAPSQPSNRSAPLQPPSSAPKAPAIHHSPTPSPSPASQKPRSRAASPAAVLISGGQNPAHAPAVKPPSIPPSPSPVAKTPTQLPPVKPPSSFSVPISGN
ncbi:early nodulin-like protein 2 [Phtheirospermum japonicum]|uniref:Early nodulin-like protein 2 n=1 Tax=Phtheirospermum japonicum TaxID=374723 RepID=A0A830BJZ5_9LAMI|nr:early nodulin-like protein 2 [Phtheirospermum japonicum]